MSNAQEPIESRRTEVAGQGDGVTDSEIARVLAVALAMREDPRLQQTLRGLAGAPAGVAFAVGQPDRDVWLTIDGGRVTAGRRRPEGMAAVEQEALRSHAGEVTRLLRDALAQTTALADAARLVGPLLRAEPVPSRQDFAALRPWVPAVEQIAYKTAASLAVTLDLLRPHLVPALHAGTELQPGLLSTYWQRMHAMAQCSLLASDIAARSWLGDMARQFNWVNWTPTFVMLRERTTWLAACAARSAVAFGEPVVENYLATLAVAEHPFKVFDALFGLAAIALSDAGLSVAIAVEVRHLRHLAALKGGAQSSYVRQIYDDALDLIEGTADWADRDAPEVEALGWLPDGPAGIATGLALRTDPAIITQSGHVLGFVILPTVVGTPIELFNPDKSFLHDGLHTDRALPGSATLSAGPIDEEVIATVVRGAWSPLSRDGRVLH